MMKLLLFIGTLPHAVSFLPPTIRHPVIPNPGRNSLIIRSSTSVQAQAQVYGNLQEFNIELDRFAEQCGDPTQNVIGTAERCENLWKAMADEGTFVPDTVSLNTVLKAWNRCCMSLVEQHRNPRLAPNSSGHSVDVYTPRDTAERATTILLQHINDKDLYASARPDNTSFNIVMDAWARSRIEDAPQAAERLLRVMLDQKDVEPDTITYHSVLDAWVYSGQPESLDKAKQIFKHMQSLFKAGKPVKPGIRTINSILHAHAKHVTMNLDSDKEFRLQLATEAYDLLKTMEKKFEEEKDPDYEPDILTYNTIIDIYARCGSVEACLTAEKFVKLLQAKYEATKNPNIQPNMRTYTGLINAWSRTPSPESPHRVEEILELMKSNPETQPNTRAYTAAIQCWSKSNDSTKAKRALKILKSMKDLYAETGDVEVAPNSVTYNSAIQACSRCQGTRQEQTEALKIAFAMFKSLEADKDVQPISITYINLMKATSHLLPPGEERNSVAVAVLDKAVKAGLVETSLLKIFKMIVDGKTWQNHCGDHPGIQESIRFTDIPAEWRKNVR